MPRTVIGLFVLLAGWVTAAVPAELIKQLGDPAYAVRAAAETKLVEQLKADPAILPKLQRLQREHVDPEVRLRIGDAIRRAGIRLALHDYRLSPAAVSNGTWKVVGYNGPAKGPPVAASHSWSNGVLRISSMHSEDYYHLKLPLKADHLKHRLQIDAELRILEENAKDRRTACAINVEDDQRGEGLMFAKKRIHIYNQRDGIIPQPVKGWVRVRIVTANDFFTVYVDDMKTAAKGVRWTRHPRVAPRNQVLIGDMTYASGAVTEWRNVRVQVFELEP